MQALVRCQWHNRDLYFRTKGAARGGQLCNRHTLRNGIIMLYELLTWYASVLPVVQLYHHSHCDCSREEWRRFKVTKSR